MNSTLLFYFAFICSKSKPGLELDIPAIRVRNSVSGHSLFITPSGKQFWSFGVCCVDQGPPKDKYDPKNPSYHAWSLFPTEREWALDSVQKLQNWGFNTLGGWSDYSVISKLPSKKRMPYTVVLHLGAYFRAPWDDLFSLDAKKAIERAAYDQIQPIREDKNLIGYFTDNELGWWDDTLFLHYLKNLPLESVGRKTAHAMLKKLYGSFDKFKLDWNTECSDWDDFARKPSLTLKPNGRGMRAVNLWMRTIGEHYYKTVHDAIRKNDQSHLILGDRYQQYYNIELARSSSKWIDVCSTNMGADWIDGTFSPFFLRTLHQVTRKPILISEFYMCSTENRSGNKNSSAGFPVVPTQVERAKSFLRNVHALGELPYVIGAHWFQFSDEPQHGRGDGENFNMGLVDINGLAYQEVTDAARAVKPESFLNRVEEKQKASRVPFVSIDPMSSATLLRWPRSVAVVRSNQGDAFADLFAVQTKDALYIALYAMDFADESLYVGGNIPESERSLWNLKVGNLKIGIRFGGQAGKGKPLSLKIIGNGVQAIEKPDLKHTIILKVPFSALGGRTSKLSLTGLLQSHSRGESMGWKSNLTL